MTKRNAGIFLVLFSLAIGLIEWFSLVISSYLGEIICGECYLQPVQGVVGDVSCGFNADMVFILFLVVVLIIGVTVTVRTR